MLLISCLSLRFVTMVLLRMVSGRRFVRNLLRSWLRVIRQPSVLVGWLLAVTFVPALVAQVAESREVLQPWVANFGKGFVTAYSIQFYAGAQFKLCFPNRPLPLRRLVGVALFFFPLALGFAPESVIVTVQLGLAVVSLAGVALFAVLYVPRILLIFRTRNGDVNRGWSNLFISKSGSGNSELAFSWFGPGIVRTGVFVLLSSIFSGRVDMRTALAHMQDPVQDLSEREARHPIPEIGSVGAEEEDNAVPYLRPVRTLPCPVLRTCCY